MYIHLLCVPIDYNTIGITNLICLHLLMVSRTVAIEFENIVFGWPSEELFIHIFL